MILDQKRRYVPALLIPVIYFWITTVEPTLMWLIWLWAGRRSERIARFLRLADDLWMRDKRIYHTITFRSRR